MAFTEAKPDVHTRWLVRKGNGTEMPIEGSAPTPGEELLLTVCCVKRGPERYVLVDGKRRDLNPREFDRPAKEITKQVLREEIQREYPHVAKQFPLYS